MGEAVVAEEEEETQDLKQPMKETIKGSMKGRRGTKMIEGLKPQSTSVEIASKTSLGMMIGTRETEEKEEAEEAEVEETGVAEKTEAGEKTEEKEEVEEEAGDKNFQIPIRGNTSTNTAIDPLLIKSRLP